MTYFLFAGSAVAFLLLGAAIGILTATPRAGGNRDAAPRWSVETRLSDIRYRTGRLEIEVDCLNRFLRDNKSLFAGDLAARLTALEEANKKGKHLA